MFSFQQKPKKKKWFLVYSSKKITYRSYITLDSFEIFTNFKKNFKNQILWQLSKGEKKTKKRVGDEEATNKVNI